MKKSLLALAVLGTLGTVAYAQSNVTLYGTIEANITKRTGVDAHIEDHDNNAIGFKGTEDLGNGYKALFQLERRFDVSDGTLGNTNSASWKPGASKSTKEWEGAANVGISGAFGTVRVGRLNQVVTEYVRKHDPFNQLGVGTQFYGRQRAPRVDNAFRYDLPAFGDFKISASYQLGHNTNNKSATDAEKSLKDNNADNDGYEAAILWDNGTFQASAGWGRLADSHNSSIWGAGIGWRITPDVKVSLQYEDNNSKGWKGSSSGTAYNNNFDGHQRNWLLGLDWKVGPGVFKASAQYDRLDSVGKYDPTGGYKGAGKYHWDSKKAAKRFAVGYKYNVSKRTSFYGNLAYTDYDDKQVANYWTGVDNEHSLAYQVGIIHKF